MSAPETGAQGARNDYQEVVSLMKKMGSKRGFDPIPPDQHAWAMGPDQPPLYRLWGWMCARTIHWGHRKEYAVDQEGREAHIEHAAADLEMDEANVRRSWRHGVARGLWRNGTRQEGKRRLYLNGSVVPGKITEEPEDADTQKQSVLSFPPSILKILKDWPKANRDEVSQQFAGQTEVRNAALREVVAITRDICDDDDDRFFAQFQPPPGCLPLVVARQEHAPKNATPEDLEARRRRGAKLRTHLEELVQTTKECVQSVEKRGTNVRTEPDTATSKTATLLPVESIEKPQESGVRAPLIPPASPAQPTHRDEVKSDGLLPAPKQPAAAQPQARSHKNPGSRKSAGEEAESPAPKKPARGDATDERLGQYLATHAPADPTQAEILYAGIPALQKRYQKAPFAQKKFSALGKGDQQLVKLILAALEGDDAAEFLQWIESRCERGDIGLGLFPDLAREFHREAPERARRRAEWDAEEKRQAEFTGRQRQRGLQSAREILASTDPKVTSRDRELARELVDEVDGKSKGAGS